MNFTELCAEVYKLTGRPDKVAATESAVKAATLKAHQYNGNYFYKDIYEIGIKFDAAAFLQTLDYRNVVPLYRAFKYLRKYDFLTSTPGTRLDLIDVDQVFDRYKSQKSDICYVAGAYIQINSSTSEQYYLFGCYVNPNITDSGYSSWVALDHPYAIVYDAAAAIFKQIGKTEDAAAMKLLVAEQMQIVISSNVVAEGF